MSLKITIPRGPLPPRINGTVDGTVPVLFENHPTTWRVAFGEWSITTPAVPNPETWDVRSWLYEALARYRNAHRIRPNITA